MNSKEADNKNSKLISHNLTRPTLHKVICLINNNFINYKILEEDLMKCSIIKWQLMILKDPHFYKTPMNRFNKSYLIVLQLMLLIPNLFIKKLNNFGLKIINKLRKTIIISSSNNHRWFLILLIMR